ncbi:hypothetical protein [Crystallibacter crystallopoietes]|uniref:hypothetical protein n=1 Tax=Crystallibacter crystallopoietes TaxID=37928 RepID=UPI00030F8A81|nr:hypothetical protein [Arthrobacter crystallopoietes]
MKPLPEAYEAYLAKLKPNEADALRPVFQESVAEGDHGVLIRGAGSQHIQALVDERVPFGQIHEGYIWD